MDVEDRGTVTLFEVSVVMKVRQLGLLVLACCFLPVFAQDRSVYALININRIGFESIQQLKARPALHWWIELEDQLLVYVPESEAQAVGKEYPTAVFQIEPAPGRLAIVRLHHPDDWFELPAFRLARGGKFAVIQWNEGEIHRQVEAHDGHQHAMQIYNFQPNLRLSTQFENLNFPSLPRKKLTVEDVVNRLDVDRWFADLDHLACYNRYTTSPELVTARDYIAQRFRDAGYEPSFQSFTLSGAPQDNVIAVLPGRVNPDQWYIIGAHYDSISENPTVAAPGAEDNASGTAGVLEMARIFKEVGTDNTVVFICYSGEELGLVGSQVHVDSLFDNGDSDKVVTSLIMDMIGFTADDELDCLLETNRASEFMVNAFAAAAANYTKLKIVVSFNPFGSDHMPYLNSGIPSLLVIENDWNQYPSYHRTTDLPANIDLEMGGETLAMNLAAMAEMVGAVDDGLGTKYLESWNRETNEYGFHDQDGNGRIDICELIRVYGELSP